MKAGLVMGLSEALKEEVTFDKEKVTNTDWSRYKVLKGFGTGGEAPNAVGRPTVAAAFFDATGVQPRRISLTPAYVTTLLKS
jgi:nicotinate dehydrogenase subunit B